MSKSVKILSIIGIILASLGLIVCCGDYVLQTGVGAWLFINSSFLLALSIVALVKSSCGCSGKCEIKKN